MFEMTFTTPWILLLLPVCLALTIWFGLRVRHRTAFVRICAIALRSIGLSLLILAMAGTGLSRRADVTASIFVIDLSESASTALPPALALIQEAEAHRTAKDAVGIIAFGESAAAESLPSVDTRIGALRSFVNADYTNIAAALTAAQSAFPEGMKRRIVLVSDGLENIGSAITAAQGLRAAHIEVDVLPLQTAVFDEVQIVGITAPRNMRKGLSYELEAELYSKTNNSAIIALYKNNRLIAETAVDIRTGTNRFVFTDTADESGGIVYRAEIRPASDRYIENNRAYAYAQVKDEPRVLVVDYDGSASEIARLLEASSAHVTTVHAVAAPATVDLLNAYDSVILADVPLDELPYGFDTVLESYVQNTGGGVLVVGGENSYALGGYYKTGLETLLPVEMRLKDSQEVPTLGMIVVLDRSGSMSGGQYGVSKLALAKEAVIRSVDALSSDDTFGVLAFDDGFSWAVPFAVLGRSAAAVQNRIGQITEGGGTSILPGLQEAVRTLQAADTKLKHIILLTDGQAEQSGYEGVLRDMADAGITLSSIAVGSDSDQRLLKSLAEGGNGRYYYTDEFTDLPQIFTRETTLAGKAYLNNRTFVPSIGAVNPILTGISALPPLDGYISTTAKPRADVVLRSDTDEPILAAWQYGLGRTVAWTTDASNRWAGGWLASDEGTSLLRNALSWTLRQQSDGNVALSATRDGKDCVLTLTTPIEANITAVTGTLAGADGEAHALDFRASAPGAFRATVADLPPGAYVAGLTLAARDASDTTPNNTFVSLGVSVSYSEEYDMRRTEQGTALLAKIADITGGRVLQSAEDIYRPVATLSFAGASIETELLAAALILLLFDIALRRFPSILNKLEAWLQKRLFGLRTVTQTVSNAAQTLLQEQKTTPANAPAPKQPKKQKQSKEPAPKAANTSSALLAQKKKSGRQ